MMPSNVLSQLPCFIRSFNQIQEEQFDLNQPEKIPSFRNILSPTKYKSSTTISSMSSSSATLSPSSFSQKTTNSTPFTYSNEQINTLGVLGFVGLQLATFPIERMKILHQVDIVPEVLDEEGKYLLRESTSVFRERSAAAESNLIHYRGFLTKLLAYPAHELAVLLLSERVSRKLQPFSKTENPFSFSLVNMACAAVTGTLVSAITYPFEVAKTRIIADMNPASDRVIKNIRSALFKEGFPLQSIYNGFYLSTLGSAVYRGLQIGIYESALQLGLRDQSAYLQIPISIGVTMLAQTAAYPIDSLRRQMMLKDTPFEISSANSGVLTKRMSHKARVKDLWRGYQIQMYKSLSTGVFLFLYKSISDQLQSVSY